MTILALEFSSDTRSAALLREGRVVAHAAETGGRATHAFRLIDRVLHEAALEREAVTRIGVSIGPGSSTGIRVAISIAQAWQFARPSAVDLASVRTTDLVAAQGAALGLTGLVHVAVDAQRQEFYLATYDLAASGPGSVPANPRPLHLATWEQVQAAAATDGPIPILAWDAAARRLPGAQVLPPDAAMLARLAASAPVADSAALEPVHLREIAYVKAPPARTIHLP